MKTLVIHPTDPSTIFLKLIYENLDFTIVNDNLEKSYLIEQINSHDRIFILGHGNPNGLLWPKIDEIGSYKYENLAIDKEFVKYLKTKELVLIWCNADQFVKEFDLKCFHTGNFISEWREAFQFLDFDDLDHLSDYLVDFADNDILFSNELFSNTIRKYRDKLNQIDVFEKILKEYHSDSNPVMIYNQIRIYNNNLK